MNRYQDRCRGQGRGGGRARDVQWPGQRRFKSLKFAGVERGRAFQGRICDVEQVPGSLQGRICDVEQVPGTVAGARDAAEAGPGDATRHHNARSRARPGGRKHYYRYLN